MVETVTNLIDRSNWQDGDYINENGYLCCGKCHTEKQHEITLPAAYGGGKRRVGIMCKCASERYRAHAAAEEREKAMLRVEALRKAGITDEAYLSHTFAFDDMRDPKVSQLCREYVEHWLQMEKDNTGLLFYGDVGTGKTYYACCIANALIAKGIPASVTTFPMLLSKLQGLGDQRRETIERLQRYPLLVIDDLGVERDTSYSLEQISSIIDARARSGKPLIITTNLMISDLENPSSMDYKRIYDRILGMCPVHVKMAGKSRRIEAAEKKRDEAKQLLMPEVK